MWREAADSASVGACDGGVVAVGIGIFDVRLAARRLRAIIEGGTILIGRLRRFKVSSPTRL